MESKLVIGTGADYVIAWQEQFSILSEIESLIDQINEDGNIIVKSELLTTLDPQLRYCLARSDNTIQSVDELIESFTFLDSTIYHNQKMHASLHQKISIHQDKQNEFEQYLTGLRDALSTLKDRRTQNEVTTFG